MQFMALARSCHVCGSEQVVGHSVLHADSEHWVCRKHNLEEWADSLSRNKHAYYRELGRLIRGDAERTAA
jgi:hypothetical protein